MKIVKHLCSASGIEAGKTVSITAGETSLMDDVEADRWIAGGLAVLHEDQKSKPTHDRSTGAGLARTGRSAAAVAPKPPAPAPVPKPENDRPGTPPGGGSIPPGGGALEGDAGGEGAGGEDADHADGDDLEEVDPSEGAGGEGDPEGETGEESQVPPKKLGGEDSQVPPRKPTKAERKAAAKAAKKGGA
jgi:hypothetical protein